MPLKHFTETVLVLVLAAVTVVTGIAVSVLPSLPGGWLAWVVVFAVTLAYPLGVYVFLRRNRADYTFRILHFFPAAIVALWLVLQLLAQRFPRAGGVLFGFLWGHAAVPVLIGLMFLALFCLQVIRRRVPRLAGLAALTALFAGFVVFSQDRGWGTQLAGIVGGTGPHIAATSQSSGKNLAPSSVPAEEEWRQKLRDVENKSSASSQPSSSVAAVAASSAIVRSSASSRPAIVAATPPNRLPTSGFGAEAVATLFVAGYCGVVHRRASRRMKA